MATASSSFWNVSVARTGPKISSRAIVISGVTPSKTVASKNAPLPVDGRGVAAGDELRAFPASALDVARDVLALLLRDERAEARLRVERVARRHLLRALDDLLHERVVDRLLDEQAGARRAELALAVEDGVDRALRGGVEVGVGEDDVGRLAAELHRDALDRAGRGAEDGLAGLGLAGERDLVDARVLAPSPGRRRAPGPGIDVEGAGRQSRLGEQLGEHQCGQGRDGGGLQDDGVAERERRRDLPHGLQEREVPRRDRARRRRPARAASGGTRPCGRGTCRRTSLSAYSPK